MKTETKLKLIRAGVNLAHALAIGYTAVAIASMIPAAIRSFSEKAVE